MRFLIPEELWVANKISLSINKALLVAIEPHVCVAFMKLLRLYEICVDNQLARRIYKSESSGPFNKATAPTEPVILGVKRFVCEPLALPVNVKAFSFRTPHICHPVTQSKLVNLIVWFRPGALEESFTILANQKIKSVPRGSRRTFDKGWFHVAIYWLNDICPVSVNHAAPEAIIRTYARETSADLSSFKKPRSNHELT